MSSPTLKLLKEQTRIHHESLEQSPLLSMLLSESLTLGGYLSVLEKFYGFFAPLEKVVNQFDEVIRFLPDFSERRKASLLLDDIYKVSNKIGYDPDLNECEDLPQISGTSKALGCIYVMEGSTLGGRFIYNNLEKVHQLNYESGASFFYGYGGETGKRWLGFQSGFLTFHKNHDEVQASIDAAIDTFDKLRAWINN